MNPGQGQRGGAGGAAQAPCVTHSRAVGVGVRSSAQNSDVLDALGFFFKE